MTNDLRPAQAIAAVGDARFREIAGRAYAGRIPALDGQSFRDLPGKHYGRPVTWRAWAFGNPRATKYDRLILVARYAQVDDGRSIVGRVVRVVAQVVPLQHASGYPGATLDVLPAIDPTTGRWAKLWRITWTDGTFDVIAARSRVRAKFLAANRVGGRHTFGDGSADRPGVDRIERAWL